MEVSVSGTKFSEGELKRLIPIYQEGAVDPDLLEEGKRNLRERLEREGYFDADVSYKIEMHDVKTSAWHGTQETILYTVERGDKHKLVGIEISGNKYFDTELLKSRLQIFQGAFGSPGRFSRRLVDADAQSMQSLYQANGFLDGKVTPHVEDNYKGKEGDLFISFTVQEGKQTRVASLAIEGIHAFKEEELMGVVGSTPGQPYSDFGVAADRANILALYFNEGFPEATFSATAERVPTSAASPETSPRAHQGSPPLAEKKQEAVKESKLPVEQAEEVRLDYHIQEGPQTRVRRVLISGYQHTRPGVIRREVRIKVHEPLREGDVVESQRRALLGYSAPNTFVDSHLSFHATAFAEKTRDINTFTEQRYDGSVQLTDQVTALTTVLFRYAFRQVRVSDLKIPSQEIPLFNQPTLVSQFGVTWFRDSRDNPADASKGSFNSADFGVADTYIGSSASFLRFFYQNSSYHPIKRRFSFARSIRFGILGPYRETVSLSFPAPTTPPLPIVIPLPERFFAGGGTSLRGFALNQAGPRDSVSGFPVGGQALLVLNQEFRFPMRLPFLGTSLGGAFFYDGGNGYSRLSRISFRTNLPSPALALQNPSQPPSSTNVPMCVTNCSNELNYFSHTAGLGFRYKTPVGPIRIDLGYQLNRPLFIVPIPCPSNAPSCVAGSLGQKSTRLPGFQIFFSLGPSF